MTYRFKARSIVPGEYRLASGVLSELISLAHIKTEVGRGDGQLGTLVVQGHASAYASLTKETGPNSYDGVGICAKLVPTSTTQWGYWDFYIPGTEGNAFSLEFYGQPYLPRRMETLELKISIWDANNSLLVDSSSITIQTNAGYQLYTISIPAPTITGLCRVRFEIKQTNLEDYIYIDRISCR